MFLSISEVLVIFSSIFVSTIGIKFLSEGYLLFWLLGGERGGGRYCSVPCDKASKVGIELPDIDGTEAAAEEPEEDEAFLLRRAQ